MMEGKERRGGRWWRRKRLKRDGELRRGSGHEIK